MAGGEVLPPPMTRQIDKRLATLEARRSAALAGDPIADWRAAYRAGLDVSERNRAAGAGWVNAAIARCALADQTLLDFGDYGDD